MNSRLRASRDALPGRGAALPGRGSEGQSLVEFALVLPVLLLLLVVALDFGRIYLGYINVQNMARIGANYAAGEPTGAWGTPSSDVVQSYRNRILNDARATNCSLPAAGGQPVVPMPVFSDATGNGGATDVGDTVTVSLTCSFGVITPLIANVVGGSVNVSASAAFPVKQGLIATSGGGGSGPTAAFTGSPTTGVSPLTVQFTDQSSGNPTAWSWDFNGDGIADSTAQDPQYTFNGVGAFSVTLVASNANGSSTLTKTNYISVSTAPATVSFTATPTSGTRPLTVQFTDTSTGSPTSWAWDFDNDGTIDSTLQNPTYTYTAVGTYTVTLTATNAGGPASRTVPNMISVQVGTCTVPNFAGQSTSAAQGIWNTAGFTTTVQYQQGNLPWTIQSQNQVVGQAIPCNSTVKVSKN